MNKVTNGITTVFFSLLALSAVQPVMAVAKSEVRVEANQVMEARKEARTEFRQEIKTTVEERKSSISSPLSKRIFLNEAKLTAKNGTTLTVTKDSKTYSVVTDSDTQLRRRFWGKATLDEMQVGDNLNIIGTWTDDAKTTIKARLVRDTSIQKRFGVFVGVIKSTGTNSFVLEAVQRGTQTVTFDGSTKLINRKGQTIAQSDLVVGHRVRVRGMWNNTSSTITEVVGVKDFSLPTK